MPFLSTAIGAVVLPQLDRCTNIDDFAPNLSLFFSNGMDPEYSVPGRRGRY